MNLVTTVCAFINIFIVCQGRTARVSRNQAGLECGSQGGLAPPSWFAGVPHTETYPEVARVDVKTYDDFDKLDIDDGESAWVGGYAEFGPGLAWYDCFRIERSGALPFESIGTLYECATMCQNYTFIGVKYMSCICLQDDDLIYPHALCDDTRTGIFGVYLVNNRTQQAPFQCNYINYINNTGVYRDDFDKCSSKNMPLCVGGPSLKDDCSKARYTLVNENNSICLIKETTPWSEGFEICQGFSWNMLPHALNQNWLFYLSYKPEVKQRNIWLGTFRTFRISDLPPSTHMTCLSATRVGSHMFLEPENCSRPLKFICTNNSYQGNEAISIPILIAVLVSIMFVFVLAAVAYRTKFVCKLLQQVKSHRQVTLQTSSSDLLQMDAVREDDVGYSNPLEGVYYSTVDDDTRDDIMRDVTRDQQHAASIEPVPQESEYNVALNYQNDKPVDVDGPHNVYAHCVRTNNSTSGDYDVSKMY